MVRIASWHTPVVRIASWHTPVVRITAEKSREVPPEWESLLRRYHPIIPGLSHLIFKWEHRLGRVRGELRDRSRWTLWQVQPRHAVHPGIRAMLEDIPPRALPREKQQGRYAFVDDWQWEYYRAHGGYPRPFWILQGPPGGHPASYTDIEAAQFKAMGDPTDPPPVGAMVYRPFDVRVIQRMESHDLLAQAGMMIDRLMRESDIDAGLRAEADTAEKEFRKHFVDWFGGMMTPSADFLTWYTRRTESDRVLRQARRAEARAAQEFSETYVQTGQFPREAVLA